jgi:serine/threonine protein kinase
MELNAPPSKTTGRYQLQSLAGEGGGGSVYCAWDTQLSRTVAIKRLKTDALATDNSQSALQEAMRLAAFHHPNIVAVYDFGYDDEGAYVIMEFIQGETVDQIVSRGTFPLEDFMHLAEQSLEGLIAAHHN